MVETRLKPRSAFDDLDMAQAEPMRPGEAGLRVTDRGGLHLAAIIARAGRESAVRTRMNEQYGLDLPNGPRRAKTAAMAAIGTGPSAWLVGAEPARANESTPNFAQTLEGFAAVADHSSAYAVLRLSGPRLRDVVAKGIAIDFHPTAFGVDAAAVTLADHIGVILWRVDAGDALTLDIAVPRSYFGSFWSWLAESSASVGLAVGSTLSSPADRPQSP